MIKGLGYLKYLKLSLIGFGIACFMGLGVNSVNATVIQVGLDRYDSSVDSQYHVGSIKGGGVLTDYLGTTKSVFAVNENILFWWASNGLPYFYGGGTRNLGQGFFKNYYACDELTGTLSSEFHNCSKSSGIDTDTLKGFFSKVVAGDYMAYSYGYGSDNQGRWSEGYYICWSSAQLHQSLCFSPNEDCNYNINQCTVNLENSQNLNSIRFGNLPTSWLSYAPGQAGYGGGGNIEGGNSFNPSQSTLTGDMIYSNVGTGFALKYMQGGSRNFKPDICYAGTFDSTSSYGTRGISYEAGTGYNIFQLYNLYYGDYNNSRYGLQSVANWIDTRIINYYGWFMLDGNPSNHGLAYYDSGTNLWEKYYEDYSFPFANNPVAVYFLANNIYDYGLYYGNVNDLPGSNVVDYCNMLINGSTIDDMISPGLKSDIIGNYSRNQTSPEDMFDYSSIDYTSSQWKADGSSWNGVFDSSSGAVIVDGTNFINTFFNKVKSKFQMPANNGGGGFLPGYIIVFMLALIFFRYLRH